MPRCKNCKEKFEPIRFNQKYCLKDECLRVFVAETKEKQWKQTKTRMKNDLKTTSDWMKEAQKVFNTYIRHRDKGLNCISCNKPPLKKNCGHYYSQGGHSNVRYDEDNCHLQCEHCNTYLSGNLLNYQIGIEKRIGAEKLIELQGRAHLEKKWSVDELKEIIKTYKQKIKNEIQ
jgi:hypothetical protein